MKRAAFIIEDYLRHHGLWQEPTDTRVFADVFEEIASAAKSAIDGRPPPPIDAETARRLLDVADLESNTRSEKAVIGELRWVMSKAGLEH